MGTKMRITSQQENSKNVMNLPPKHPKNSKTNNMNTEEIMAKLTL